METKGRKGWEGEEEVGERIKHEREKTDDKRKGREKGGRKGKQGKRMKKRR